ncbi:MAG: hypothetical protein ACRELB_22670, partial [Polyangiaceae bacterium]
MRGLAAALVLAGALAAPAVALANAPAPYVRQPGRLGGAFVVKPTSLVVEHETLSFSCPGQGMRCEFEAVYHVRNDGDAAEEVLGAFYGIASGAVTIRAGGADVRRELTPDQRATTDEAVFALDPTLRTAYGGSLDRTGFDLAVGPHARVDLVFSG